MQLELNAVSNKILKCASCRGGGHDFEEDGMPEVGGMMRSGTAHVAEGVGINSTWSDSCSVATRCDSLRLAATRCDPSGTGPETYLFVNPLD